MSGVVENLHIKTYQDRQPEFEKVKLRILDILLGYREGLTCDQITLRYIEKYKHVARIDNRLRDLRREGEIESFPGPKKLLIWKLSLDWKGKPDSQNSPRESPVTSESETCKRVSLEEIKDLPSVMPVDVALHKVRKRCES